MPADPAPSDPEPGPAGRAPPAPVETPAPAPRPIPTLDRALAESALLHAVRASTLRVELERRGAEAARPIAGARPPLGLAAARAGHRLRFAALLARRTARALGEDGPRGTWRRIAPRLGLRAAPPDPDPRPVAAAPAPPPRATPEPPRPAATFLARRVLIVAELSIPQCTKYRVRQRVEALAAIGTGCTVIDWHRVHEARSLLQTHVLLILYRVPGTAEILSLIEEARRLGVGSFWEVDDLIFDVGLYARNANLLTLPEALRRELLDGVALYRVAMRAADATIASTPTLAQAMREATGRPSHVVPNALDAQTQAFARRFARRAAPAPAGDATPVRIVYGSGTRTHDADFAVAAPALLRLLAERSEVVLRIVGELSIDPAFARFGARVERYATADFQGYLALVAACDVSIAPLEDTAFNDAKSNIKLIEASVLGLPSVCSPRAAFRDAIEHGVDGLLADDARAWFEALAALVRDPALRERLARASRARVEAAYAPEAVAARAVAPLLAPLPAPARARRRILVVNVFFAPRSFGGATLVAEEMAVRLDAAEDTEVMVFTTRGEGAAYTVRRARERGLEVFAVATRSGDTILDFDDPEIARCFAELLDATAPDLVHFHSIQTLGVGMLRICQMRAIPYAVTLHDAWWLCTRQFMVRADNRYCHQRRIDLSICETCVPTANHLAVRLDLAAQGLAGAALVLSPSADHLALHAANGLDPARLLVNRNGIRPPARPRPPRAPGPLRFGYVGGNEALKGVGVIRAAFAGLGRDDWHLVLVDNLLNLGAGLRAYDPADWRIGGRVEIVPAYRRDGLDAFFEGIDVLLFPSQWKESFGLTVREALARDVWVIATACGGGAEQIVPGVNGEVIPMSDRPGPLAAAVARLLDASSALDGYANPRKDEIVTIDAQARALDAALRAVLP